MRYVADYSESLGDLTDRAGARGRALAEMVSIELPVPPGFVISDVACRRFLETGDIPPAAWSEVTDGLERSAQAMRRVDPQRPVLYSVRSSPAVDMPGLYNSALYLGCTARSLEELGRWGGRRLASVARLGFLQTIGRLRGLPAAHYSLIVTDVAGPLPRAEWSDEQIAEVCRVYEAVVTDVSQRALPTDTEAQVREGIESVFASWDGAQARRFRRIHGYPDDDGMGVVVHPVIFGEAEGDSGAGYVVSRNPENGAPEVAGVFQPHRDRPDARATPAAPERLPLDTRWNGSAER